MMFPGGGNTWAPTREKHAFSTRPQAIRAFGRLDARAPLLERFIDACLLCLLFLAPLFMGGRHPIGQFVWLGIALAMGLATALHYRPVNPSPGDGVWLAAMALVVLQLIPIPVPLLAWLSPGITELIPALTAPNDLPYGSMLLGDRPLSINPYRTRLALGMLLAYGIIFHTVTRRVQSTDHARRLIGWIAVATTAMAALALAQRFAGNGKFLWVYQHISRDASDVVKGPFQNENHFAQLMALGIGPLLYFATSRSGFGRTALAAGGTTICLLAGLLTFSRGGVVAITVASMVAAAGLALGGVVRPQRWLRLLLPAAMTMVLLTIWGGEMLLAQMDRLSGKNDLATIAAGRFELWEAHLRAIAASPWVGYGAATHEDIYPAFIDQDFGVTFTHGESGFLPVQLENGLIGSGLLICGLAFAAWWTYRAIRSPESRHQARPHSAGSPAFRVERRGLAIACAAGLAASVVQSIADFVWYIPACITPTLILAACVYRLSRGAPDPEPTAAQDVRLCPRAVWLPIPVALLLVAATWGLAPARAEPLWHQHRIASDVVDAAGTTESSALDTLRARTELLRSVVARDPADPAHRFRLAASLLSMAEADQRLSGRAKQQVCEAALLNTAVGLRQAPLRGEGYVLLANISRLRGGAPEDQLALLEQAVRVRPSDLDVNFKAGLAAFRSGHVVWGLDTWKPVMEFPTRERNELLATLGELLPTELILASFSLDHTGLAVLYNQNQRKPNSNKQDARDLGGELVRSLIQAASSAEDPAEAAALYHQASLILQQIDAPADQVLMLAQHAVSASPAEYSYRIRLTNLLISHGRREAAREHLRWCQLRKPTDPKTTRQEQLFSRTFR